MRFMLFASLLFGFGVCVAQESDHIRSRTLSPALKLSPASTLHQSQSNPSPSAERTDAAAFVAGADIEIAKVDEYANRASWVKTTNITPDTDWLQTYANVEQSQVTLKFMKEAARYNGLAVDPVTRRKLEIIKLASSLPPPDRDEGAKELAALTTRLDSSYATRAIPYGGRNLTRDEASEVARNLQDPAEM